jgi:hypothetical protein
MFYVFLLLSLLFLGIPIIFMTPILRMSGWISRVVMKFSRRSIKRFIGVKDGFRDGFMAIEGEKIESISKWLGSPSMASLGMPSLNSSQCLFRKERKLMMLFPRYSSKKI